MALLVGAAVAAQAAGLGKLTVNSALGQILNAEIDLVSLQPGELDSLSARVASRRKHSATRASSTRRRFACCVSRSRSAPTARRTSRSRASRPSTSRSSMR